MSEKSPLADAIKEHISIVDYAKRIGLTVKPISDQYTLAEHDSVRIKGSGRVYYRHSTGRGGSIIDFCMEFEGLEQNEAIRRLRGLLTPASLNSPAKPAERPPDTPKEHKKVELPEAHPGRYDRLFAYESELFGKAGGR